MQEMKGYLDVLTDSLEKKVIILDEILKQNELQAQAASAAEFDMEAFEQTVSEKDVLIQEIVRIDSGFESVYERVRIELDANKGLYKEQIRKMKQLIQDIADKSVAVSASEARNKKLVEASFSKAKQQLRQGRTNVKAASDYYKNMSRVNYIDPQMLDTKK